MPSQAGHPVEVVALLRLSPSLLQGRTKLGQKVEELVRQRPRIPEYRLEDGTPTCPQITQAVQQARADLPGLEQLEAASWLVDGREVQHLLISLTATKFAQAAAGDGLASILHAAGRSRPAHRLHLLTWPANTHNKRLWQMVADLAVWRPDVAFYCAPSLEEAAAHVCRLTRAVAEETWKRTTARSFVSVHPQSDSARQQRERLEKLLVQYNVPRGGAVAALMRALQALPNVCADAAYAVGLQYGSLQALLEALESDGADEVKAAIQLLPLPASNMVVGPATAERVIQLAVLQ